MMSYQGDFTTSNTVYVYFNTFTSDDPAASVAIAALVVGDIEIYKNGSATTRSSDNGYTLLDTDGIDFASNVGIGGFSIDLSNDTDSGFYAAGGEYMIMVGPVTVDAGVVNFVAATFSIERTGGALALMKKVPLSDGSISWNATALASINTEVDTALASTNYNEPATGAPGVNISIEEKISWIYTTLRNKKVTTNALITVRNDADSADIIKKTIGQSGGTYTEDEFISG